MKAEEGRLGCRSGFNQYGISEREKTIGRTKVVGEAQPLYLERMAFPIVICKVFVGVQKGGLHGAS
jgi:hypothetical protein